VEVDVLQVPVEHLVVLVAEDNEESKDMIRKQNKD
jgi:hypothetical protein